MFDTTNITKHSTEYVPYEKTVTINRAPTDESIKLYDEIKEKAYSSIIGSLDCSDNVLKVTAKYWKDIASYSLKCGYIFLLNGKEIKGIIDLPDICKSEHDMKIEMYKKISHVIAIEFMQKLDSN